MAETKREIERKYEPSVSGRGGLPDLTGVAGVAKVVDKGSAELDATYYDTPDLRLAAHRVTLRRRTGGSDAGWHLKFPVAPGVRDEIRAPLSDTLPRTLAGLLRSRVRDAEVVPVVRLRSARAVRHLLDADGALLAEISVDEVRAERLTDGGGSARWTEVEVELADGGDPGFLDKVDKRLRKAGLEPSASPSKPARALAETAPKDRPPLPQAPPAPAGRQDTAGHHLLAYVRAQRDDLVALDPAVRRDVPDSVHAMRVATRRLRSVLRSYGKVLDRRVTDPIGAELKWLAGELGAGRDQEVLAERLTAAVAGLSRSLVVGPVRTRLRTWSTARRGGSRRRLVAALDGRRHLALLDSLDALLADPPLLAAARGKPKKVFGKAVREDFGRLAARVERALALPPGTDRDTALHEARKKAKRTRYAAEAAVPVLGGRAAELVRATKALQELLGDHQDGVMARGALRELAAQAHQAGESAFSYGLLYGREERRAAEAEAELPGLWRAARECNAVV
ncbi:CHAD domain-containing protein [Streptomyces echinoruber]|uniref:CHAD domain-containing protein n=1 Tax=Streptomyces echinoruber TaxID=68898 RepID=A0A918V516_9ACTN|nr:CYTH and CHAD domain-containing protein [Streptomyces echinoruber]GGZ71763.1 CHAD domain-containing protein [Streptomyces echinoruber]